MLLPSQCGRYVPLLLIINHDSNTRLVYGLSFFFGGLYPQLANPMASKYLLYPPTTFPSQVPSTKVLDLVCALPWESMGFLWAPILGTRWGPPFTIAKLVYDWLVLWNICYVFPHIGNVIIPTDELIFFRGVGQPPTRWHFMTKIIVFHVRSILMYL